MTLDVFHAVTVLVVQCFLASYVLLLLDFREPRRRWRRCWAVLVCLVGLANVLAILLLDYWAPYTRLGLFTMTLPYVLITLWCSRSRGRRAFFNVTTTLFVGCVGSANGILVQTLLPDCPLLSLVVRTVSYLLLYLFLRRFRSAYRRMLDLLDTGWTILCLIPVTTYLCIVYITNVLFPVAPLPMAVVMYGLLLVCGYAYWLMYLFFDQMQQENEARNSRSLLELQVAALKSRLEAIQATEEAIRVERHDLRHRLQTVARLVARGERDEALNFLDAAQQRLNQQQPVRWCRSPVLDAVFAAYFDLAGRNNIAVEAQIALPDDLPVDEQDLAIVFANALENAIQACTALPQPQRRLRCKVIHRPGLMFEISNPCLRPVQLNDQGLPVSTREGHGLGVRSICAFCQKYHAACRYEYRDGWFSLRIIL